MLRARGRHGMVRKSGGILKRKHGDVEGWVDFALMALRLKR